MNSYIYFSFDGDVFDVEKVTNSIGIEPSSVMIKGDPIPKSSSWKLRIDALSYDVDLEIHTNSLIDLLEPKINEINELKLNLRLETRLQFVIYINGHHEASTPFFGLNKRTIRFLNLTETTVDFDLYKIGF